MISNTSIIYIDTFTGLQRFCESLAEVEWIALDTEFIRERTYYPKFCLLQIATSDRVACIDPLTLDSLAPLDALFDDPGIVKVFHAARQDLEILYFLRGRLPAPVFDTQAAAPFVGLPEQIGYASLTAELLGVSLDKAHSRTDWSIRPLSAAQIGYAADDVIYLGQIYRQLRERLTELGRLDWATEEMRPLADPLLYDPPATEAWQRVGGLAQLSDAQLPRLCALATWRELEAREQDCPRNWLVKDDALVDLARRNPVAIAELRQIRGIDERIAKRFGTTILDILRSADAAPTGVPFAARSGRVPESPAAEALLDVFTALVRLRAVEHTINPTVLATRKDLREFVDNPEQSRVLQGWRRQLLGDDLLSMLRGEKSLSVVDGRLQVAGHA